MGFSTTNMIDYNSTVVDVTVAELLVRTRGNRANVIQPCMMQGHIKREPYDTTILGPRRIQVSSEKYEE